MHAGADSFRRTVWREQHATSGTRILAEEVAVAMSYNGSTHAVLMATPVDLQDFAIGFSVTEGIVDSVEAIEAVDIVEFGIGLDIQIRVRDDIARRLASRRRSMAGPVGCGMCGLESLEAATRHLPPVTSQMRFKPSDITTAAHCLEHQQSLNQVTGAAHAAAFLVPGQSTRLVREDVGRHNALDKLIGATLSAGIDLTSGGFLVTSRASVELVQKTAIVGCGLLAAISAPTAYAARAAEAANLTLAAVVRGRSFEVFSGRGRIDAEVIADVA